MKKIISINLAFFISITILAQTGPGGVGNSTTNAFWIKADAGTSTTTNGAALTQWNDVSGNGNHVTQATVAQQPIFTSSLMNGYPSVSFDNSQVAGQNDFLTAPDAANLDNTNGLTIFTVIHPVTLGSARSIIAKRTNVGVNQAYMFFFFTSNYCYADIVSNDNRFSTTPTAYAANQNYIFNLHYDGTLAAASRAKIYLGQTLVVTATESATTIPDYNSPLIVGATHVGDNRGFGGYISEVIIYRVALSSAPRIIVDNYLSAKYNIALSANDVYQMDNAGNGDFDHDVAGIGRISAADLHTDTQGGIVRILNADNLDNNEFFMWGHNNGVQQAIELVDVPPGVEARFDRVWRASELSPAGAVVDVGGIDIRWDLSTLGPVTASDLRLLVDRDNDGVFSDETPISGASSLGAGVYQFTGVTAITNGLRFTLGTINSIQTPLPIELLSFNAQVNLFQQVDLTWQTASESNNHYFTVERSKDGINWIRVTEINGAGNSSVILNYSAIDKEPYTGLSYYRLKQTDYDNNFTFSNIRTVTIQSEILDDLFLYPNPTSNILTIESKDKTIQIVKIFSLLAQEINEFSIRQQQNNMIQIDLSNIPSGIYFLYTNLGVYKITKI